MSRRRRFVLTPETRADLIEIWSYICRPYLCNFNPLTTRRQVDILIYMSKKIEASPREPGKRRIVGFSLQPALATEVKVEAAKRNLTLRKLFDEMWALYKTKKTA